MAGRGHVGVDPTVGPVSSTSHLGGTVHLTIIYSVKIVKNPTTCIIYSVKIVKNPTTCITSVDEFQSGNCFIICTECEVARTDKSYSEPVLCTYPTPSRQIELSTRVEPYKSDLDNLSFILS